jgi:hypothetical protein
MKLATLSLAVLLFPFIVTIRYVRSDGGTAQQCNGSANVPYSDAVAPNCALKNLQEAINAMTFGDTTAIDTSAPISTTPNYAFGEFTLPDKGTPPTNTDADYMTITTTNPAGIPAALFNYPAGDVKITRAMSASMPTVIAEGSTPLFRIEAGAKYWRIRGLHMRNDSTNGWQTIVFIDTDPIGSLAQVPHHIIIEQNVFEPDEEQGGAITAANINRSAENAIYLTATDFIIQNNAMQGFQGRYRYGNEVGHRIASAGVLIPVYAERGIIRNNYIDPWTYGFFSGGSSMPDWLVTKSAQVVSCALPTVCTLSTVDGLSVGDPVSALVAGTWGSAFVSSISGTTVTLAAPFCHSYDGGNTCQTITGNPTPAAGDRVRFKWLQPRDILVTRNRFKHYPETASLMDGDACGKGYLEVKAGIDLRFIGNVFDGCSGPTVTVRNQSGDFAGASLNGLTFESNLWQRSNRVFTSFLRDSSPTPRTQNVRWFNNLILGVQGNTQYFPGGELSGATTGGLNTTISHNTVAWDKSAQPGMSLSSWHNFVSFQNNGAGTMEGFVVRDNVIPLGTNFCWNTAQTATLPIGQCWPNAAIDHNVFVNADNHPQEYISQWWPYANNRFVVGYAGLFQAPNSTLTVGGNYRPAGVLLSTASDGGNIGYDHDKLVAALGFDPNTGVSQPSPQPTPTATPLPTATPTPAPVASPSPGPTPPTSPAFIGIQGYVYADGVRTPGATVTVGTQSMLSRAEDAYFWFDSGVPVGAVITAVKDGYTFPSAEVRLDTPEQLYFMVGTQVVVQPSPTPTPSAEPTVTPTPVVSPSPVATPSPSATPLPSPSPSPTVVPPTPTPTPIPPTPTPTPPALPVCKPNQVIGSPPVCRCTTMLIGNPRRCKP